MEGCELSSECPFFKGEMSREDCDREMLLKEYCATSGLRCARVMVHMAVGEVPSDLFPPDKVAAYELIAEKG